MKSLQREDSFSSVSKCVLAGKPGMLRRLAALWLVLFGCGLLVAESHAVDRYWQNSGGGDFTVGGNWSGSTAPGASDNAYFTNNATYAVTYSANVTNQNGYFNANSGTITLDPGSGKEWRLTSQLYGNGAGGTVDLISGTMSSAGQLFFGNNAGNNNNTFRLYGGAVLAMNGTYGDANFGVDGSGNTVIISNGASLLCTRQIVLGYNSAASNTTVVVTGSGSMIKGFTDGSADNVFIVGARGANTELRIEDGGVVTNKTAYVGGGSPAGQSATTFTGNYNRVVVSGGFWTNTVLTIGNVGFNNRGTVTNGGVVRASAEIVVGSGYKIAGSNTLEIVSGTASAGQHIRLGFQSSASNNTIIVSGSNALLQVDSYDLHVGENGSYNTLTVTNSGHAVVGRIMYLGEFSTASSNLVQVTGTGSVLEARGSVSTWSYVGYNGVGNRMIVENGGVFSNCNLMVGNAGSGHSVVVTSGGVLTNTGTVQVGNGGRDHSLTVLSNGVVWSLGQPIIGNSGTNNTLTVGPGGTFVGGNLTVGTATSLSNAVIVAGAGAVLRMKDYDVVVGSAGAGANSLVVSNGGQVLAARDIIVGTATAGTNSISVGPGGLLEGAMDSNHNSLKVGTAAGNTISNVGGVFQFPYYRPAIVNGGSANNISITDGTLSFRNIINADVLISAAGGVLDTTKMSWNGANTFMLNAASNATSGQAYTFQTGAGATNFARLALVNGSLYRGGNVSIGANGTLMVSNGVSTIVSNLTFAPSATFAVDLSSTNGYGCLVAQTNVTLNGCALSLNLGTAPVSGSSYQIISNSAGVTSGSFSTSSQEIMVNNTNYVLRISPSASGVRVTCNLVTRGTRIFIQ